MGAFHENYDLLPRLRIGKALFLAGLVLLLAAACSSASSPTSTPTPTIEQSNSRFTSIVVSSDLAVGPNRLVVGLIDQEKNAPVNDAPLHFRLFKLEPADQGHTEILKAEMDARPITIDRNYTHLHDDGARETHQVGKIGVYAADVDFDSPGEWGVEITGTVDGQPLPTLPHAFDVRERSLTVAIGEPAPRSVQRLLSDVDDIFDIDTSNPPDPHMHTMTIADAVTSGKATVIVIATPGFCHSRICGPSKDVVDDLYEKYQGQANFIHVEPFDLEKARSGQGLQILPFLVEEWGLQSEPWVFLVDKEGKVAAKFEGIVSFEELESAMTPLMASAQGEPSGEGMGQPKAGS